jgi:hypothetical protein
MAQFHCNCKPLTVDKIARPAAFTANNQKIPVTVIREILFGCEHPALKGAAFTALWTKCS